MSKLKMLIEVDFASEMWFLCKEGREALMDELTGPDADLLLHSNCIGDTIGEAKVLWVGEYEHN